MPQFSMIPERAKILDRIPDYEVLIQPLEKTATVQYQGKTIAQSDAALLVKETRHNDVVYLPVSSMIDGLFEATEHSTYCPFKGHANYWSLAIDGATEDNLVWGYADPYPEVAGLKGYVAFYADRSTLTLD